MRKILFIIFFWLLAFSAYAQPTGEWDPFSIHLDGGSTTTSSIAFAEGIDIAKTKLITFDGSTDAYIKAYSTYLEFSAMQGGASGIQSLQFLAQTMGFAAVQSVGITAGVSFNLDSGAEGVTWADGAGTTFSTATGITFYDASGGANPDITIVDTMDLYVQILSANRLVATGAAKQLSTPSTIAGNYTWSGTQQWDGAGVFDLTSATALTVRRDASGGNIFVVDTTNYQSIFGNNVENATSIGTATISNASPAVVTRASHGLSIGDRVFFTSSGEAPSPLHPIDQFDGVSEYYYIISSGFTANSFQISLTAGGAAINTTTAGSGTHTLWKFIPNQLVFDSAEDLLVEWRNNRGPSTAAGQDQWTASFRRSNDQYFQYPGYAARFAVNTTQVTDYESPVAFSAFINAGANTSELYGFWGGIYDQGGTGSSFNISNQGVGILCYNYLGGSAARTLANIIGGDFTSELGSNITGTNIIGGRFQAAVAATSATFTNSYGVRVLNSAVPTMTNNYGVHIASMSGATNNYGLFLATASNASFRAGTQAIWSSAASTLDLTANTTYNFKFGANPANGTAGTTVGTWSHQSGLSHVGSGDWGVAGAWKGLTINQTNTRTTSGGAGTGASISLTTSQTNGTHNLLTMGFTSTTMTSGQIRGGFFSIGNSGSETPGVVGYSIGLGRGVAGAAQAIANNEITGFVMDFITSTNGGTGYGLKMSRSGTYPAAMVAFQSFGDITTLDDNLWDIGTAALQFGSIFLGTSAEFGTAAEARFRAGTQRVYSSAASTLDADTNTTGNLRVGGTVEYIWNATKFDIQANILDMTAAKAEMPALTALPATCVQGEYVQDTDSDDCANTGGGDGAVCVCKTTNTWALVANI